ncbi:MAG: ImmA/IrrE family metallo-endopeptidase [Hyphomicrobiales bacterium]|nr:ImmA/IrrE family metallo-endopeptidase [Hyphomicrobiales bacterium]
MGWPSRALSQPELGLVSDLADEVRRVAAVGYADSPRAVSLRSVCEAGDFRVVRTSRQGDRDAYLLPRATDGFDVVIREGNERSKALARRRLRFALAHEIGHSFFFSRRTVPHGRSCEWTEAEEAFCNRFASELLIPGKEVRERPWSPATLRAVREEYDVSMQAAAHAVAAHLAGGVVLSLMQKDHPTKGRALRIIWSAGAPFVPERARLGSEIAEVAWERGRATGTETLALGHLKGCLRVEAEREHGSDQVLVMIRPRSPLEEAQLTLFAGPSGAGSKDEPAERRIA